MDIRTLREKLNKKSESELRAFIHDYTNESGAPGLTASKMSLITWLIEYHERKLLMAQLEEFVEEQFSEKMRRLLTEGFSDHDIYRFMYDSRTFRSLVQELGYGRPKYEYINRLIEYCESRLPNNWMPYAEVQEWAKKENPSRYRSVMS